MQRLGEATGTEPAFLSLSSLSECQTLPFLYRQARFMGYSVEGGGEREALAERPGGMGMEQAALTDGSTCQ